MALDNKGGMYVKEKLKRSITRFRDNEKVGNIPNEIFSLVIMETMDNFDVSRILIDEGSSCDIIYVELFKKLGLKKEKMSPYTGCDLQAFNDSKHKGVNCVS